MKIRTLQALTVAILLIARTSSGQITQLEQKETRTFLGTQNRGYGPYDYYKFSGATNSLTIPEGKKISILDFYHRVGHTCSIFLDVRYGTSTEKFRIFSTDITNNSTFPVMSPAGKAVIGPAVVELILYAPTSESQVNAGANIDGNIGFSTATAFWRYETTDYGETSTGTGSLSVSAASIVVPSNAVGDVDVLLEQSNDMITWTQCLPGTYNASTQKRFFRVRAVEK
jgi:hypothetical protein